MELGHEHEVTEVTDNLEVSEEVTQLDLLKIYFRQVGLRPRISVEEEVELAKIIEAGAIAASELKDQERSSAGLQKIVARGEAAERRMVEANLRLVVKIALERVKRSNCALMDLIQAGNMGLVFAVRKFDYRNGNKFSTYAKWWIRREMIEAERIDRAVYQPKEVYCAVNKARNCIRVLRDNLLREPTHSEVEAALKAQGFDSEQIEYVTRLIKPMGYLSQLVNVHSNNQVADTLADQSPTPESQVVYGDTLRRIREMLDSVLTPLQASIVLYNFGFFGDYRPGEIAAIHRVRPAYCRRLYLRSMELLRIKFQGDLNFTSLLGD